MSATVWVILKDAVMHEVANWGAVKATPIGIGVTPIGNGKASTVMGATPRIVSGTNKGEVEPRALLQYLGTQVTKPKHKDIQGGRCGIACGALWHLGCETLALTTIGRVHELKVAQTEAMQEALGQCWRHCW